MNIRVNIMWDEADIVYTYTRKQAIEDGVLVDVTDFAREVGFKVPVAITDTFYNGVVVPKEELAALGQSVKGRLWDLLFMLHIYARKSTQSEIRIKVLFQMKTEGNPENIIVKAIIGPGDKGEPVLTIMYPYED